MILWDIYWIARLYKNPNIVYATDISKIIFSERLKEFCDDKHFDKLNWSGLCDDGLGYL